MIITCAHGCNLSYQDATSYNMAFERLQALGKYLKECQPLENYEALREEQCASLCHQIRDGPNLDFDGGATLLAMIQQENLWTDIQKQALGACIQEKVQEGMKGQGFTNRTQMQDYQYFPLYLTTQEWSFIQQQRPKHAILWWRGL